MECEYDNLKRVISYSYSYYDSTTGILLTTQDLKMQYHNNDTLPYTGILKDFYYDHYEEDVFVLNCSFNNGKLPCIGNYNSKNPQDSIVQKILYRGESDITYTYQYPLGSFNNTSYHKVITVNGNILQDITSYSYYTLTGLQGIYTYNNLFDDHANPFNRISFVFQLLSFYTLPYDPGEDGSFTKIMALSKNNIVESKFNRIVYQFSDDNYYSKSYIYNSNGLPVYASYTKQLAQQGQFYAGKELYFYTK